MIYLLNGTEATFMLICASLLHEAAHLICIHFLNAKLKRIDIGFSAFNILYDASLLNCFQSLLISAAGIMANIAACLICFGFFGNTQYGLLFAFINISLALCNLVPIAGTDGDNITVYAVCAFSSPETADSRKVFVSTIFKLFFLSAGLLFLFLTGFNLSFTVLFVIFVAFTATK